MKILEGKIVSTKMKNTMVVEVVRQRIHPKYKKIMRLVRRYKVDAHGQLLKVGETVKIQPTRPISKEKHYRIVISTNKEK